MISTVIVFPVGVVVVLIVILLLLFDCIYFISNSLICQVF
jgi:hypothetical protein